MTEDRLSRATRLGLQGAQAAVFDYIDSQGGTVHQAAEEIGKVVGYSLAASNEALYQLRVQNVVRLDGRERRGEIPRTQIPVYCLNEAVVAALLDEDADALGLEPVEAYAGEGRA